MPGKSKKLYDLGNKGRNVQNFVFFKMTIKDFSLGYQN